MTNIKLLLTAGVDERVDVTTSLFKTKNAIFFVPPHERGCIISDNTLVRGSCDN